MINLCSEYHPIVQHNIFMSTNRFEVLLKGLEIVLSSLESLDNTAIFIEIDVLAGSLTGVVNGTVVII